MLINKLKKKKKIPKKRVFGYADEAVVFWNLLEYKVTQVVSEVASYRRTLDLTVREKAHDPDEG